MLLSVSVQRDVCREIRESCLVRSKSKCADGSHMRREQGSVIMIYVISCVSKFAKCLH